MNTLKTVVILSVLGAVGYGVYLSMNKNPSTTPLQWAKDNLNKVPNVEMGDSSEMSLNPNDPLDRSENTMGMNQPGNPSYPSNLAGRNATHPFGPNDNNLRGEHLIGPDGTYPNARTSHVEPVREYPKYPITNGQSVSNSDFSMSEPSENRQISNSFHAYLRDIHTTLRAGNLAEAQSALSHIYSNPNLPPDERRQVIDLLGQVTGTVMYSDQHILERPYTARAGDTIQQVGEWYRVPWQMLAKINGIRNPDIPLSPGQQLKVLRGPFAAEIRLSSYELTLRLGSRYAGRFQIGIGDDIASLEGNYVVHQKHSNPDYEGPNGTVAADNPANPLGERLIELKSQANPYHLQVAIHGTNDPSSVCRTGGPGAIRLQNRDIDDLCNILSEGSTVTILR